MRFMYYILLLALVIIGLLCVARYIISRTNPAYHSTICCVAGKSGGHIVPCLTLAQQYKHEHPDTKVLFFSTDTTLDHTILDTNKTVDTHIALKIDSPKSIFQYPILIWRLLRASCTSFYYLLVHKPTCIISTGGLVSVPVCLAAWLLRIPIELYELNAVPGKATLLLARMATGIHICFEKTAAAIPYACTLSPYPVRFTQIQKEITHQDAQTLVGCPHNHNTLLILGGSQGSLFLNNSIKQFVEQNNTLPLHIIHQTGAADSTDWQQFYQQHNVCALVFAYHDNIALCYRAADLIITRAGAGSLFEIAFFNTPSIVIPLEADTTDHQVDNAYAIQEQLPTLFTVVRQKEIAADPIAFHALIRDMLTL
jgi:UDP-N-acetylglucosamine--N-acetylmuramyl-(pentapeptide) pyrophosphoryl-undecaprenol N-acetylglucosamine transferase